VSYLIKYATNAFLATKISFANEMAELCEALGAEAPDVLKGLGLDHRVGSQFLKPGPGYGGSCLPKDIRALTYRARKAGVRMELLRAAERVNARQRRRLVDKLAAELGGLAGRTVAVWGLAFKAGTDDLRGAAAVEILPRLLEQGAQVRAYDPAAADNFARLFPPERHPGLTLVPDHWAALHGADALLILTEWDAFRTAPLEIRRHMAGRLVIDGRNLLHPDQAASVGLMYHGVGRGRPRET
jgi:UDPglucose 6-dehydrogenase